MNCCSLPTGRAGQGVSGHRPPSPAPGVAGIGQVRSARSAWRRSGRLARWPASRWLRSARRMIAHARVVGLRAWLSLYSSTTTLAPRVAYCSSRRTHWYSSAGDRSRAGRAPGLRATNTGSRVGVAGWPLRWRAAAMARWRTASGLRAGMPRPWRVKALRSDGQVVPSSVGGGVDAAQLLGELEGAFGLAAVGQEAAGLPAHPPLGHGKPPLGPGGLEDVAVDAELAGGLPQPDLVGEGVGGLGQVAALPVGAGLGEGVAAQPASLGRQGAAEDAVIGVDPAGGVHGQVAALVADLAGATDLALASAALVCSPGSGKNRSGSRSRQAAWSSHACRPPSSITATGCPARSASVAWRRAVRSGPRTWRTRPSRTPTRRATSANASRCPPWTSHSRHSCSIRSALVSFPPRSAPRVPRT